MPFEKGNKLGPGRPKGLPNIHTMKAREAIGLFVDNNAEKLQEWLDIIANGKKGKGDEYIIEPNPEKAFQLFQSVIEYHVPKLARTELSGKDGKDLTIQIVKFGTDNPHTS